MSEPVHKYYIKESALTLLATLVMGTDLVPDSGCFQGGQSVAGCSQIFSSEHDLRVFGYNDRRVQV